MSTQTGAPTCSPAERLAQMANSFVITSAISAVIRLNIAEAIGDSEMSIASLAEKTGTNADALYRVLRTLSTLEIFVQVRDGVFANTEASHSLRADVADSQRAILEFVTDPFHMNVYADMVPTLKTGRTAVEHVCGKNVFDVFKEDSEEQRRFDNAMTAFSRRAVPAVLHAYDFSGIDTLVDIAGGHGMLLTGVLEKYPLMKGILFDLPHVTAGAQKRIDELGMGNRCRTIGGDFFESVPTGDAYIMRHIVHDWDDEQAVKILRNCHTAMAKSGARKLLVVEMIVPGTSEPHPSYFLDIEMLMLPGGRERTESEFRTLLEKAGFTLTHIVRTQSPNTVIEAVPN